MKKILSLLFTTFIIHTGFSQTGFKPLETSKKHLYSKDYGINKKNTGTLYKGDIVHVNNLELNPDSKDPFKLKAIEDINAIGNYVFDGIKWRAVGNNLARQTHFLSYNSQALPLNSFEDQKIKFNLSDDKLFQNVTRFYENDNEFEIFYTGFHEVSGSLYFNARRSDLISPNSVSIIVKILNGKTIISQIETDLVGTKAGEWTLLKIPAKKLKLNSGDKISMVISRVNKSKNSSNNFGNGNHIEANLNLGLFSKSLIIEKL